MQIIVPMSGFGERFRKAGYTLPKPLIPVEGKPIIAHVIDLFPGETRFIFICNQDHLDNPEFQMRETLQRYCPTGKVIGIPSHKLGPVHAVQSVRQEIALDEPTIVNYCDFTCYWDWHNFKEFARLTACDGIIPAYRGFHPHTLGTTNYAYMRETDGWVVDIQEKQPYTNDRMNEFASSGTYYFRSGRTMLDAFDATVARELNVNGEYYVSLTYKPLLDAGKPVAVYPLQHFMQWGTPEDVAEYTRWSDTFRRLQKDDIATRAPVADSARAGAVVVPMAGLGQRFAKEGYRETKPLIAVSGAPMVEQAVDDLPAARVYSFVLRKDMPGHDAIAATLAARYPNTTIVTLPGVTDGQARSALLGLEALMQQWGDDIGPVTFGACDNGAVYVHRTLDALFADAGVDVAVWATRGHPNAARHPKMFGWIDADDRGVIRHISVKQPLSDPRRDPIVIGTFTFRRASQAVEAMQRLFERDGKVNGEFYLDSCVEDAIALGLQCRLFEVDSYLCWGTPDDLRTFEYWQSCFDKWPSHPYRLANDPRVPANALRALEARFEKSVPAPLTRS